MNRSQKILQIALEKVNRDADQQTSNQAGLKHHTLKDVRTCETGLHDLVTSLAEDQLDTSASVRRSILKVKKWLQFQTPAKSAATVTQQ